MISFTYPPRMLTVEEKRLQILGKKKLKIYQDFMSTHKNLTDRQELRVFSLRLNNTVSAENFVEELKKI